MGFQQFQVLQPRLGNIPEIFHPSPTPQRPVYDTSAAIAPLLKLADYLSPESRAKRKAAVAKANYEYRMYSQSDPRTIKDPFFLLKVQKYRTDEAKSRAYIAHLNKTTGGASYPPEVAEYYKSHGLNLPVAPTAPAPESPPVNEPLPESEPTNSINSDYE